MQPLGLPQHSEHHTLHSASPGRAHSRRRPARADAPSSQSPHASRQQQLAPCSQQPAAASSQQRGRQLLRALRSVCEQLQGQIRPGKRRRASRAPLFAAINWRPWAAKGPDTSGLHGLDTQEIFDSLDRNHDSFLDAKELSVRAFVLCWGCAMSDCTAAYHKLRDAKADCCAAYACHCEARKTLAHDLLHWLPVNGST